MRYISELIGRDRNFIEEGQSVILPYAAAGAHSFQNGCRLNLLALGDVGGMALTGLRLLSGMRFSEKAADGDTCGLSGGNAPLASIGIYDLNEKLLRRYEREAGQICFPDGRKLPPVWMLAEDELFDCDVFVFCASKGVPPLGEGGDVRMAQLAANKELVSLYDFCRVCKIPFEGSIEEPHRNDVEGFIDMIAVGETRKVSDARITSIHFPVLRYFAIFASRCLNID